MVLSRALTLLASHAQHDEAQSPVDGGDEDGGLGDQEIVEAVLGLTVPVLGCQCGFLSLSASISPLAGRATLLLWMFGVASEEIPPPPPVTKQVSPPSLQSPQPSQSMRSAFTDLLVSWFRPVRAPKLLVVAVSGHQQVQSVPAETALMIAQARILQPLSAKPLLVQSRLPGVQAERQQEPSCDRLRPRHPIVLLEAAREMCDG